MERPTANPALVCLAVSATVLVCACAGGDRSAPADAAGDLSLDFARWTPPEGAFAPSVVRVHPLTRVTRTPAGEPVLMCHVELRDRFGQVARCLGIVQVDLFRADAQGEIRNANAEPERSWQIDLRDPVANADAFDDVVTRTYVLRLASLPESLARRADGATDPNAEPERYAVRARLLFKDPDGGSHRLEGVAPVSAP